MRACQIPSCQPQGGLGYRLALKNARQKKKKEKRIDNVLCVVWCNRPNMYYNIGIPVDCYHINENLWLFSIISNVMDNVNALMNTPAAFGFLILIGY